ncbi:hypothetical protein EXIGLDRAFT_777610 [Exidia glandulosa HHB12029]|uniref:Uncharacterized protein n=1 Tax=Exidia glandulosa HHB12029 TaxID=1314781 RepID=A0A165CY33_EXIGL|nr:hypothetical protein EXIGLDRAFT_777610 [Exidia glandulosa HHB12029]
MSPLLAPPSFTTVADGTAGAKSPVPLFIVCGVVGIVVGAFLASAALCACSGQIRALRRTRRVAVSFPRAFHSSTFLDDDAFGSPTRSPPRPQPCFTLYDVSCFTGPARDPPSYDLVGLDRMRRSAASFRDQPPAPPSSPDLATVLSNSIDVVDGHDESPRDDTPVPQAYIGHGDLPPGLTARALGKGDADVVTGHAL